MKKIFISLMVLSVSALNLSAQTATTEKLFQVSFVSPIGTNGVQSNLVANKVSLNILGGYSKANTAFELGGLYNVNMDSTKGAQVAGITNVTKDVTGGQIAGVLNVTKDVKGSQTAGVLNVSKDISGVQIAGVSNVAGDVNGVQLSGIINVAKKLKGTQIGLINYADSVEKGAPIGLINIVKKNGKYEFEIAASEAINTSLSFRFGTNCFYTIISAGANYWYEEKDFSAGLGFGTHIDWGKNWGNEFELMGYALTEDGKFTNELNMLSQLKVTVSKDFHKHFKVFAGPVLNMTISQHINSETGELGSSLSPWSMWENESDKTRLNAWVGFTVGFRF